VQTFYEPARFGWHVISEQPGMPAEVRNVINPEDLEMIRADVHRTREKVDALVVSLHWGVAFELGPAPDQPELAHAVVEAGADLVLGHHAHILQGVEVYAGVPIFYSLSDFVFDYGENDPRMGRRETMLLRATFGREGLERVALCPAMMSARADPRPVEPGERDLFMAKLADLSRGMNSRFQWHGDEVEVTAATP
jgi:poly-gamma-glutamate synthesis protein (capsule biosynthesis protein)